VVFTDWPQVGFDPRKSGLNPYENVLDKNAVRDLNVVWSHKVQSSYGFSSLAVADGVAYVTLTGTASYGLYAYNVETGAFLWTYPHATSSPAVKDGVVYVNDSINLDALDARTGKLLWKYTITTTGTTDAPPTVADGRVFIGAGDGTLYALDATSGKFLWGYYSGAGQIFAAPAVANGVVYSCPGYQAGYSSVCYALDERSGSPLWSYAVDGFVLGSPAVIDGLVFFDAQYTGTYALDATTGALVWN
jgi:outer membrane protein assembly factor BamB